MLEPLVGSTIIGATRLLTGAQARWVGCEPAGGQRVYFANHTSHADFALIWSVLPRPLRRKTRPVAAGDYWNRGAFRKYLIHRVFHGLLVDRGRITREENPIAGMRQALEEGASLILFPEGTRGTGEHLQPFKSGVFHLARVRVKEEGLLCHRLRISGLTRRHAPQLENPDPHTLHRPSPRAASPPKRCGL